MLPAANVWNPARRAPWNWGRSCVRKMAVRLLIRRCPFHRNRSGANICGPIITVTWTESTVTILVRHPVRRLALPISQCRDIWSWRRKAVTKKRWPWSRRIIRFRQSAAGSATGAARMPVPAPHWMRRWLSMR